MITTANKAVEARVVGSLKPLIVHPQGGNGNVVSPYTADAQRADPKTVLGERDEGSPGPNDLIVIPPVADGDVVSPYTSDAEKVDPVKILGERFTA